MRLWMDENEQPVMPSWWKALARRVNRLIDRFWDRVYGEEL